MSYVEIAKFPVIAKEAPEADCGNLKTLSPIRYYLPFASVHVFIIFYNGPVK